VLGCRSCPPFSSHRIWECRRAWSLGRPPRSACARPTRVLRGQAWAWRWARARTCRRPPRRSAAGTATRSCAASTCWSSSSPAARSRTRSAASRRAAPPRPAWQPLPSCGGGIARVVSVAAPALLHAGQAGRDRGRVTHQEIGCSSGTRTRSCSRWRRRHPSAGRVPHEARRARLSRGAPRERSCSRAARRGGCTPASGCSAGAST